MIRPTLVLCLLPLLLRPMSAHAEGNALYWSQAAYGGVAALDMTTSIGGQELNPVVGRGPYGWKQAGVSASISVGVILAGNLIVKKWPSTRRWVTFSTWAGTGVRGYAVSRAIRYHSN